MHVEKSDIVSFKEGQVGGRASMTTDIDRVFRNQVLQIFALVWGSLQFIMCPGINNDARNEISITY